MKKLLIATTALVGSAGMVAAEVNFSGYGRYGIIYEEDRSRAVNSGDVLTTNPDGSVQTQNGTILNSDGTVPLEETRLESRFRLNIDGVTETDGGIRFAARMRVEANDNDDNSADTGSFSGARFQVSAGGFRVRVGNISGVADSGSITNTFGFEPGLIGQIGHYGTFAGGSLPFTAFSSTGAGVNGINVLYEVGDFAIMGSWNDDHDGNDGSQTTSFDDQWEIGVAYTYAGWTFGAIYANISDDDNINSFGQSEDYDWWMITASGTVGPVDLAIFLGESDIDAADELIVDIDTGAFTDDDIAYGISGSYAVGAATNILASVAGGGADGLDTEYGIGFSHSLGGGVSLLGMVGSNAEDNTVADLGVRFNF